VTPAASGNSTNLCKQIGPAIWLLILLIQHTPADWNGHESVWVAGGNVVSDSELVQRLGISLAALAGWRRRLRKLGLMGWLLSPRHGRAYWVAGVARMFAEAAEQQPGPEANKPTSAPAAAIWRVIEERSIALTGKVIEDLTAEEGAQLARVLTRGSEDLRDRFDEHSCHSQPHGSGGGCQPMRIKTDDGRDS